MYSVPLALVVSGSADDHFAVAVKFLLRDARKGAGAHRLRDENAVIIILGPHYVLFCDGVHQSRILAVKIRTRGKPARHISEIFQPIVIFGRSSVLGRRHADRMPVFGRRRGGRFGLTSEKDHGSRGDDRDDDDYDQHFFR